MTCFRALVCGTRCR